jgi:hypothetical protein
MATATEEFGLRRLGVRIAPVGLVLVVLAYTGERGYRWYEATSS